MQQKGRIFVFDDERDSLSKIYIGLLLHNFEVELTDDPAEIVMRARRFKPQLAVVNSGVKGFDGTTLCNLLKKEMTIPITLLVDKLARASIRMDGCSADEILIKPVNTDRLLNLIYKLLNVK